MVRRPLAEESDPASAPTQARRPRHDVPAVRGRRYSPADFFVLRTPLLPVNQSTRPAGGVRPDAVDTATAVEVAVQAARSQPEVFEAISVASPGFARDVDAWMAGTRHRRDGKVAAALARYMARMAARPTPFGLFAGISTGIVGAATRLSLGPRSRYRRETRLDFRCVDEIVARLRAAFRSELSYHLNHSLYELGTDIRLRVARRSAHTFAEELVAIPRDAATVAAVDCAAEGGTPAQIAQRICTRMRDVTPDEARAFVDQLVDGGIIVPDLDHGLTAADDPLAAIIRSIPAGEEGERRRAQLGKVRSMISELNTTPISARAHAAAAVAVTKACDDLIADRDREVFHVTLVKDVEQLSLGAHVSQTIARAAVLALEMGAEASFDPLAQFMRAFEERFGDQEVPLLQVLDEESGIPFELEDARMRGESPLLNGIQLDPMPAPVGAPTSPERSRYLHRLVQETLSHDQPTLELDEAAIEALRARKDVRTPDVCCAIVRIASTSPEAIDKGDYQVLVETVNGAISAAAMLGRFCYADAELRRHVEALLQREQSLRPDTIIAEIVHLPEAEMGNVIARPRLRPFEIPIHSVASVDRDHQIPPSDLLVSVREGRVMLRSSRRGVEVVPRLSSAHNFRRPGSAIYRFLAFAGMQRAVTAAWSWGPLAELPRLPRVTCARAVLALRTWNIDSADLASLRRSAGSEVVDRFRDLRARLRMPSVVDLVEGDRKLPFDCEDGAAIVGLLSRTRAGRSVRFTEAWPGPDELPVRGPEGAFQHELILPIIADREPARVTERHAPPATRHRATVGEGGEEYVRVKVVAGPTLVDRLVAQEVGDLVEAFATGGDDICVFFTRASNPDRLELIVRARPSWHSEVGMPRLHQLLHPWIARGGVRQLAFEKYQPVFAAAGAAMDRKLLERAHQVDSSFAVRAVRMSRADPSGRLRAQLALVGVHSLFEVCGLGLDRRCAVLASSRLAAEGALRLDHASARISLGHAYRAIRGTVQSWLASPEDEMGAPALQVVRDRDAALRQVLGRSATAAPGPELERVCESLVKGYLARIVTSSPLEHEVVIYHHVARTYESAIARGGARDTSARSPREHAAPHDAPLCGGGVLAT